MKGLILKVLAFLVSAFAFWGWGKASAERNEQKRKSDESIRKDKEYKKTMSTPDTDKPFNFMRKKK